MSEERTIQQMVLEGQSIQKTAALEGLSEKIAKKAKNIRKFFTGHSDEVGSIADLKAGRLDDPAQKEAKEAAKKVLNKLRTRKALAGLGVLGTAGIGAGLIMKATGKSKQGKR